MDVKLKRFVGLAAVAAVVATCLAQVPGPLSAGTAAPKFSGPTAGGKSFSLDAALKDKPVFVYFISTSCPVSKAATPHYTTFAKAYAKQGLTVVGVLNSNKAGFDTWNATHKVPYPVVLDPDYKTIKAYKVTKAPSAVLIGKNGRVIKSWTGYSKQVLVEANQLSAKAVGKPAAKLEFAGVPAGWQAG